MRIANPFRGIVANFLSDIKLTDFIKEKHDVHLLLGTGLTLLIGAACLTVTEYWMIPIELFLSFWGARTLGFAIEGIQQKYFGVPNGAKSQKDARMTTYGFLTGNVILLPLVIFGVSPFWVLMTGLAVIALAVILWVKRSK